MGSIAQVFGPAHVDEILGVAPAIIAALSNKESAVRGSALVAIGRVARGLEVRIVPLLPRLVTPLLATLRRTVDILQAEDGDSSSESGEDDG